MRADGLAGVPSYIRVAVRALKMADATERPVEGAWTGTPHDSERSSFNVTVEQCSGYRSMAAVGLDLHWQGGS